MRIDWLGSVIRVSWTVLVASFGLGLFFVVGCAYLNLPLLEGWDAGSYAESFGAIFGTAVGFIGALLGLTLGRAALELSVTQDRLQRDEEQRRLRDAYHSVLTNSVRVINDYSATLTSIGAKLHPASDRLLDAHYRLIAAPQMLEESDDLCEQGRRDMARVVREERAALQQDLMPLLGALRSSLMAIRSSAHLYNAWQMALTSHRAAQGSIFVQFQDMDAALAAFLAEADQRDGHEFPPNAASARLEADQLRRLPECQLAFQEDPFAALLRLLDDFSESLSRHTTSPPMGQCNVPGEVLRYLYGGVEQGVPSAEQVSDAQFKALSFYCAPSKRIGVYPSHSLGFEVTFHAGMLWLGACLAGIPSKEQVIASTSNLVFEGAFSGGLHFEKALPDPHGVVDAEFAALFGGLRRHALSFAVETAHQDAPTDS